MKHWILNTVLIFITSSVLAQEKKWVIRENTPITFDEIVKKSNDHFASKSADIKDKKAQNEKDSEWKRYKRWEWFWSNRINENGFFPDPFQQNQTYKQLQNQGKLKNLEQTWTNINQTTADGGYNGMGRLTSVAFHPTDSNTFYVGAPIGGIWKTIDGGLSWIALGDSLPYVSVGNIVIHPQFPDSIYITIGDHQGWWNYGLGIFVSSDAGITWNPTSQTTNFSNQIAFLKLVIGSENPNTLWSAQSNGLFKSINGGNTWTLAHSGFHNDVDIDDNTDAIYTCRDDYWGSSEVFVSYDNGGTWEQITQFNEPYAENQIALSPLDTQMVAVMHSVNGEGHLLLAQDSLLTWQEVSIVPEDWVFQFSSQLEATLYCGGINVYQSTDLGVNWSQQSMWYDVPEYPTVHADQRFIQYHPITHEMFFCNDGGLYKFNENTETWTDLSNGLIITQFYRIAVSQNDETFMIGGTQDNGGRKRIGNLQWAATNGGDAMEVAIDNDNDQTLYTTYINGQLYRSNDQWNTDTYHEITPNESNGGGWVTPYVLDPYSPSTIVAGYEDVFLSHNKGNTWTKISNNLTGSVENKITCVAIAPSDPNVIYAAYKNKIYTTIDGGNTWATHNAYLQGPTSGNITSIVVHPENPMKLWVTLGGYQNGNKIRYSQNAGTSFSNFTYNLPNSPVNCSIIDWESELFDFYVGTDVGVFVYNDTLASWNYFGTGMPNSAITDLEIQYLTRKLRAGTFGRGVWETGLYSDVLIGMHNLDDAFPNWIEIQNTLAQDQLILNIHAGENQVVQLEIFDIHGRRVDSKKAGLHIGNYQYIQEIGALSQGEYILQVQGPHYSSKGMKFIVR